jgi:hypothetical protein
MNNLVQCRYNPNHKMKLAKLLKHEETCPEKCTKNFQKCPYNPLHLLNPDRFNTHLEVCPNRPIIDKEVKSEIRAYIEAQNKEKEKISKVNLENTSNMDTIISKNTKLTRTTKPSKSGITVGSIIGMGKDSKQDKLERKAKQKEMRQLINSSIQDSSKIILEENQVDENFDLNISQSGTFNKDNDSFKFEEISVSELKGEEDYDPNASDIFMSGDNKNVIPANFSMDQKGTIHIVLRNSKIK